jgi:hypothetical protein
MKSFIFSLLFVGCAAAGVAQNVDYLTFRTADGTEQSLAIDGLKITFAEGKLVATNAVETVSYDLATLSSMFFAAQPTALETLAAGQQGARVRGGLLYVNAPAATQVQLYAIDGRLLAADVKQTSVEEQIGARLSAGTYIVKVGNQSYKLLAR